MYINKTKPNEAEACFKCHEMDQACSTAARAPQYSHILITRKHIFLSQQTLHTGADRRPTADRHSNVAPVSYTHLTLPTNREV